MSALLRAVILLVLACACCGPALADRRVALVVANAVYANAALQNPKVDAGLVEKSLEHIGFAVTVVRDADLATFDSAINAFADRAKDADVALFYYAGHGFAVDAGGKPVNILMATNADMNSGSERVLRSGGIPLDDIVAELAGRAKATLIFIDACRSDPRLGRGVGRTSRGLAPPEPIPGGNLYIGFSTRLGETAWDGDVGRGSPFARAFADSIQTKGLRIDDAFRMARDRVRRETDGKQNPDVVQDDLPNGSITLTGLDSSPPTSGPTPAPTSSPALSSPVLAPPASAPKPSATAHDAFGPKLYVLAIGVADYVDPKLRLGFAAADARGFSEALLRQKGGLYSDVLVKTLVDREVTRASVMDAFDWLERSVTSRDLAMVLISGQGGVDVNQDYWFLPADGSVERLSASGVSEDHILKAMRGVDGKAILFLDTWRGSPAEAGERATRGVGERNGVLGDGFVVFSSCRGREVSAESPAWGHSAFVRAVIEGLEGRADLLRSGSITTAELDAYVAERVKELTDGRQHPVMTRPVTMPDFAFATVRR